MPKTKHVRLLLESQDLENENQLGISHTEKETFKLEREVK